MKLDVEKYIKKVKQNTINVKVTGEAATEGMEEFINGFEEINEYTKEELEVIKTKPRK